MSLRTHSSSPPSVDGSVEHFDCGHPINGDERVLPLVVGSWPERAFRCTDCQLRTEAGILEAVEAVKFCDKFWEGDPVRQEHFDEIFVCLFHALMCACHPPPPGAKAGSINVLKCWTAWFEAMHLQRLRGIRTVPLARNLGNYILSRYNVSRHSSSVRDMIRMVILGAMNTGDSWDYMGLISSLERQNHPPRVTLRYIEAPESRANTTHPESLNLRNLIRATVSADDLLPTLEMIDMGIDSDVKEDLSGPFDELGLY